MRDQNFVTGKYDPKVMDVNKDYTYHDSVWEPEVEVVVPMFRRTQSLWKRLLNKLMFWRK